jgi:hypothetical protein
MRVLLAQGAAPAAYWTTKPSFSQEYEIGFGLCGGIKSPRLSVRFREMASSLFLIT